MESQEIRITSRCPIRTTLDLVGGKWKLLILHQLRGNALRLSELKRLIPDISEKILIQELKKLVDNKLVIRKNYGEVPPRVEYSISNAGAQALPLLEVMKKFAEEYEKEIFNKNQL